MKIGYARVSTQNQNLDMQLDALKAEGCAETFQEKTSGAGKKRPALEQMMDRLRKDDLVVVWKLDRLGRSLKDLVRIVGAIQEKGAHIKSLQDHIDTSSPQGRLTFHLFASLAEFEREIIAERTKAGLAAARARGRKGGRPKGLSKEARDKAMIAQALYLKNEMPVAGICKHLSISKPTFYSYIRAMGAEARGKQ
jgi:DNA invertase Pin-like site-specific DNA recombinase